jgi:hypothetical protein
MKSMKLILMAVLLIGLFSQASFAASDDPNLKSDTQDSGVIADGTDCVQCKASSDQSSLTQKKTPNTAYDSYLSDSGSAATDASKAEQGTH